MIEGESLPLGMINQISPTTKTIYLDNNDMVVLASDGIVDSFKSPENFLHYVNNERIFAPQVLADCILEEATSRQKGIKDDMTVMVVKLIKK